MITFLCIINGITAITKAAPQSGDIISFQTGMTDQAAGARILVRRVADGDECMLDLGLLRQAGGSFVVESESAPAAEAFTVQWAGRQTADVDDCGDSASLIVAAADLDQIAVAAGGYGVADKRLPGSMMILGR
jgi:hypothetical protein